VTEDQKAEVRSKFPGLFWLVVMFEFFERGSYYGMMSVLSVYMVDVLQFAKQDVGLIKGTIQPLLYFLPILSGALADRFGYRRMLMIAFSLLGGGYFLVSQNTGYAAVFLSLVVMGIGAGTFKPIISGTIARCTDESNSTIGFGIFYWSINLGAFLFPLILVPFLRDNIGWEWVIIASAIGTGAMLLPTIFVFKEPPKPKEDDAKEKASLLQTLANAFEIIYSPFILLLAWMRQSIRGVVLVLLIFAVFLGYGGWKFSQSEGVNHTFAARVYPTENSKLVVYGEPNLCRAEFYNFEFKCDKPDIGPEQIARLYTQYNTGLVLAELLTVRCSRPWAVLSFYNPDRLDEYATELAGFMTEVGFLGPVSIKDLGRFRDDAVQKTILEVEFDSTAGAFEIQDRSSGRVGLVIRDYKTYQKNRTELQKRLQSDPRLAALKMSKIDELAGKANKHPFLLVFVGLLLLCSLIVQRRAAAFQAAGLTGKLSYVFFTLAFLYLPIWLLPGLSLFARVLCSLLSLTVLSLYAIGYDEMSRFKDHVKFLLMIIIYSGFWVLYFQMFDSVLWYVQAYVDPTSLNRAVNSVIAAIGFDFTWRFDVEIVTVINAFTIILLQLVVSTLVKKTKALPTMIVGIGMGTIGMAILAISTGIWVFMLGIVIFSIGEMTAHPKFISYVGQTAPKSRVAMYMGYLFLYGVIGSSIGSVVGADLYVKFVDQMNQPRTLWLIFTAIGVVTIIGLLLYNGLVATKEPKSET